MSGPVLLGALPVEAPVEVPLPPIVRSVTLSSALGSVDVTSMLLEGHQGLTGNGDVRVDEVSVVGLDGAVLRDPSRPVVVGPLTISLPLWVRAGSGPAAEALVAEIRRVTSPVAAGAVTVRVVRWDGESRSVTGVRTATPDGPVRWWGQSWRVIGVQIRAVDPWWRGDARSITWMPEQAAGTFFPILPMPGLRRESVLGQANPVTVEGDAEAWPVVTVTGAAASVTVTRGDGAVWSVTGSLPTGDPLIVATDPRAAYPRVAGPGGVSWWDALAPSSVLWPLRPGTESVLVAVTGTDASTAVEFSWAPRWEAAV